MDVFAMRAHICAQVKAGAMPMPAGHTLTSIRQGMSAGDCRAANFKLYQQTRGVKMLYTISIIASTIVLCATALHLQAADHSEAMQSLLARCEAAQWDNQGSVTLMECSTLPDQYITGKAQPAPIF